MASRKPLTLLQKSQGELPVGDDLLLYSLGAAGARFSNGTVGVAHYCDNASYYLLLTASGSPLAAAYTAARPFAVNLGTGKVTLGAGVSVAGGLGVDTLAVNTTPINDATMPAQVNSTATAPAYFAANKSGGYGALFGYDQSFGGGLVRQVTTDPLLFVVNSTTVALTLTSDGRAAFGYAASVPDINLAGTGGMAGAWTSAAAAVAAQSGTLTTASATVRYKKFGRTVLISVSTAITTNGTGAGTVNVTLPFAAAANCALSGREFTATAKMLVGVLVTSGATLSITNYDGTYPAVSGATLVLSGVYEASA